MKHTIKIFLFLLLGVCIGVTTLSAQNNQLAQQYYRSGEYEKAAVEYKALHEKAKNTDYYFSKYIECLLATDQLDLSEKIIKKEIKDRPKHVQLYVFYGNVLEKMEKLKEAEEQYARAIKNLPAEYMIINNLGTAFVRQVRYDYALQAYEKGEALLNDSGKFAHNIADIHRRAGESEKMIKYYLLSLKETPSRLKSLKDMFNRMLTEEHYEVMKRQLYTLLQDDPEDVMYPELLEWVFIQQKDYPRALAQAKSLDFQLDGNGSRIFEIASIASNDKDYDSAIAAYQYIIEEKGKNSSFFLDSKRSLLNVKKRRVLMSSESTREDLLDLEAEYERFLTETGKNKQSAYIVIELAKLEAYYLDNLPKAISLLEEMIGYPGVNKFVQANGKLALGDFYLIDENIWEATLLYSQVDKDFREDYLGEMARFKNAKLSYYNGDFEWAQSQFDILKSSTSKLISNDAIDLSVFIMDNMNLDTIDIPLKMYAQAELLTVQNKTVEAFAKLDELKTAYPDHTLQDDIYYAKAKLLMKDNRYEEAVEMYQLIIDNHKEEIRCDNAIFELAEVYDYILNEPEKAANLYEMLFIDFSSSTFAVDARKRFRVMRGDQVQ